MSFNYGFGRHRPRLSMNPGHLRGEAQDFGRIKNFDLKSQKEILLDFRHFDSGRLYPMFEYKHWAYKEWIQLWRRYVTFTCLKLINAENKESWTGPEYFCTSFWPLRELPDLLLSSSPMFSIGSHSDSKSAFRTRLLGFAFKLVYSLSSSYRPCHFPIYPRILPTLTLGTLPSTLFHSFCITMESAPLFFTVTLGREEWSNSWAHWVCCPSLKQRLITNKAAALSS